MPAKRKAESTILDALDLNGEASGSVEPAPKKARVSKKSSTDTASGSKDKSDKPKPKSWKDIELEGEDDERVAVYDDCAEIRRKIRLLQKTPSFKITHWLKEIGDINNNSYKRFMEAKGRNDGAANGTYYAAYVYFEKVRILEGKKKTAKRIENESNLYNGFPLVNPPKHVWVTARR